MKDRENYFLILGLDYRKPDYTDFEIKQKLREKRRYWRDNQNEHPEFSDYERNLMEIEKTLTDPEKRKVEAADAEEYINTYLEDELAPYDGMEQIPEEIAEKICRGCNLSMELFSEVSGKRIGSEQTEFTNGVGEENVQEETPEPVGEETENFTIETEEKDEDGSPNPHPPYFQRVKKGKKELQIVGFPTLYHFLAEDREADLAKLQSISSLDLLKEYCEPIKQRYRTNHTDEATPIHTLCAVCDEIFDENHPEYRAAYDAFIVWSQIDEIIKEVSAGGNTLSLSVYNTYAEKLEAILGSTEAGKNKMDEICRYKGIRVTTGGSRLVSLEKKMVCPRCSKEIMVKKGDTICPSCGGSLVAYCLRCGEELDLNTQICPECGGNQQELKIVEELLNTAENAFAQKKYGDSLQYLQKAEKIWPGNARAAELKEKIQNEKKVIQKEQEYFTELCFNRKIYEAYKYLQEHSANEYSGAENVKQIISKCKAWEEQINNCKTEKEAIALSEQILEKCPDYPLVDVFEKFPPTPPSNFHAEITNEGHVLLSWDASDSEGEISYHIVRKIGGMPRSLKDVDGNWEIQGEFHLLDQDIEIGKTGYYRIFSKRNGHYSVSLQTRIMNTPEISGEICRTGDGELELLWNPIPSNSTVILFRKVGAVPMNDRDGQKIILGNAESYRDIKLDNGTFYGYRICLKYEMNGMSCTTAGVTIGGTPRELPKPFDDYTLNKTEDNHFQLTCKGTLGQQTRFFYTADNRFVLNSGEMISTKELDNLIENRTLIEIETLERFSNGFTFDLPHKAEYRIIPVTCNEEQVVYGVIQHVYSAAAIQFKNIYPDGNTLQIGFEWPDGIEKIMVQYSNSRYANSADEPGFKYIYYNERQYKVNDQIKIREAEKKSYYFVFYVETRVNGENTWVNAGRIAYENRIKRIIHYKISVKGLCRKTKKAVITFTCPGTDSFDLPEIEIYGKTYSDFFEKEDGRLILKIDAQRVDQNHKESIAVSKIGSETYIRPFFVNNDEYNHYELRPAAGYSNLIN